MPIAIPLLPRQENGGLLTEDIPEERQRNSSNSSNPLCKVSGIGAERRKKETRIVSIY